MIEHYFTPETLSQHLSFTPEKYLLCKGVTVARLGWQLYTPADVSPKLGIGSDGLVRIERREQEVFDPISMASLNGKPFVDLHPADDAWPDSNNWQTVFKGVVMNPRRGTGIENDLLVADVLIYDASVIKGILDAKASGKPVEVSAGYYNGYHKTGEGIGYQTNIRFNHLAKVPKGRCGTQCGIKDEDTVFMQQAVIAEASRIRRRQVVVNIH